MIDNKTSVYNPTYAFMMADSTNIPGQSGTPVDLLSNGFKCRTSSAYINAAETYIYAAFAEIPFKYATAR